MKQKENNCKLEFDGQFGYIDFKFTMFHFVKKELKMVLDIREMASSNRDMGVA